MQTPLPGSAALFQTLALPGVANIIVKKKWKHLKIADTEGTGINEDDTRDTWLSPSCHICVTGREVLASVQPR